MKRVRGSFEMAVRIDGKDTYQPCEGYIVGSLVVHKDRAEGWRVSHAETGMAVPRAHETTLPKACTLAQKLNDCTDWSRLKRGKKPNSPIGITPELASAVKAVLFSEGL